MQYRVDDDIKHLITTTWNQPRISAYLNQEQDREFRMLSTTTTSANVVKKVSAAAASQSSKKYANGGSAFVDETAPEVVEMKRNLSKSLLRGLKFEQGAELFVRNGSHSDVNAITEVKPTHSGTSISNPESTAIVTISIHGKSQLGVISPNSQHAFLSDQTLGDVFEALPCPSNELPEEICDERENVTGYQYQLGMLPLESTGCLICIGDLVYGDGMNEKDYAHKLQEHMQNLPKHSRRLEKAPTSIYDTTLQSLTVQIDKPYWLLHKGNCEHFVVIDEIRLLHPSDPKTGYPIGLYFPPILMDMCRVCTKKIAKWSIVGDTRLKDSPCMLCEHCWDVMGESGEGDVVVVPLAEHQLGW